MKIDAKIEKTPSGSYRVRKQHDGKRYSMFFDHKPSQREISDKFDTIKSSQEIAVKGTFEELAKKYMLIQNNVLSPSTLRSYGYILEGLSDDFKKKKLKVINQADVQEEINKLCVDKKPKTVRNMHAFISAVIKMYRPEMQLYTKLPQKIKPEKRVPTQNEVAAVLDAVKNTRYSVPYRLACYGLRRSEICALTTDDLSDSNILTINKAKVLNEAKQWVIKPYPKTTESQRSFYIDDELANDIREQGYIYNGHPHRLYDYLKETQDVLKIPRFRLHDFRGYMVTELSQAGYTEADILKLGGWSTPYVMKSTYRQARIQSELDKQKEIAALISNKSGLKMVLENKE